MINLMKATQGTSTTSTTSTSSTTKTLQGAVVTRTQFPWKLLATKGFKLGDTITVGTKSYILKGVIGAIHKGKIEYRLILI